MGSRQARPEHEVPGVIAAGNGSAARSAAEAPGVADRYEGTFGVGDLSALRRLAAGYGHRARLAPGKLDDFVLAVNEVATNAVCRGGRARLRLWVSGNDVCCEVRGGTWISARQPSAVPDDTDSLRLWVVWQVCGEVSLSYGPGETTVRLSMRTAGGQEGASRACGRPQGLPGSRRVRPGRYGEPVRRGPGGRCLSGL